MMHTPSFVTIVPEYLHPDDVSSVSNSSCDRSRLPVITIISRSGSLAIQRSFPGGTTLSTIKSRDFSFMALQQFSRIIPHCSSGQSWRMFDKRQASLPGGISLKKSHSTALQRSSSPRALIIFFASRTTAGLSATIPFMRGFAIRIRPF